MKNLFGDAIGEIAGVRIDIQVDERQNSDRVSDLLGCGDRVVHFLDNFLQTAEDDGSTVLTIYQTTEVSESLVEWAKEKAKIEKRFLDESGKGPVGMPKVLYVLACVPN